jgi:O-methyltransferase
MGGTVAVIRSAGDAHALYGPSDKALNPPIALVRVPSDQLRKRLAALRLRALLPVTQRLDAIESHLRLGSPSKLEHSDFPPAFLYLHERVQPLALASVERDFALYESVRYIVGAGVRGDIVECGVWAGGSSMLAALTLRSLGATRRMWLYDTFGDFPHPGEKDEFYAAGQHENKPYERAPSLDQVKANMAGTGQEDVVYVEGPVEETIPSTAPEEIALLRLDTDWYESTRHELDHLYPRLSEGGVLIIDDYGHFQGARRAVDEYFHDRPVLLNRIDYTGRLLVKRA